MITLTGYWMGRDSKYRAECTEEIQTNADETVRRVNLLLTLAEKDGIVRSMVSSGWRPPAVNDGTANAAKRSSHLLALAVDVQDLNRELAQWCVNNKSLLVDCQLWMEDPRWTPTWVHLQTVPPNSGKLVYIPSSKPALASALIGQSNVPDRVVV